MSNIEPPTPPAATDPGSRHLRFGWSALLVFISLGLVLEALHGFKVPWYLHVAHSTRRHMWTLAHAHGTLLSLIHLVFAAVACGPTAIAGPWHRWASRCLYAAIFLMPSGFLLGGLFIYGGDPGLGIALVPAGGLCLWIAVFLTARFFRRQPGHVEAVAARPVSTQHGQVD